MNSAPAADLGSIAPIARTLPTQAPGKRLTQERRPRGILELESLGYVLLEGRRNWAHGEMFNVDFRVIVEVSGWVSSQLLVNENRNNSIGPRCGVSNLKAHYLADTVAREVR